MDIGNHRYTNAHDFILFICKCDTKNYPPPNPKTVPTASFWIHVFIYFGTLFSLRTCVYHMKVTGFCEPWHVRKLTVWFWWHGWHCVWDNDRGTRHSWNQNRWGLRLRLFRFTDDDFLGHYAIHNATNQLWKPYYEMRCIDSVGHSWKRTTC